MIKDIYESVLNDADYLKDIDFYELNCDANEIIEAFFIWLGVTKYVQLNDIKISKESWESDKYIEFVFSKIKNLILYLDSFFQGRKLVHLILLLQNFPMRN